MPARSVSASPAHASPPSSLSSPSRRAHCSTPPASRPALLLCPTCSSQGPHHPPPHLAAARPRLAPARRNHQHAHAHQPPAALAHPRPAPVPLPRACSPAPARLGAPTHLTSHLAAEASHPCSATRSPCQLVETGNSRL
jgi:hypothetical protein